MLLKFCGVEGHPRVKCVFWTCTITFRLIAFPYIYIVDTAISHGRSDIEAGIDNKSQFYYWMKSNAMAGRQVELGCQIQRWQITQGATTTLLLALGDFIYSTKHIAIVLMNLLLPYTTTFYTCSSACQFIQQMDSIWGWNWSPICYAHLRSTEIRICQQFSTIFW